MDKPHSHRGLVVEINITAFNQLVIPISLPDAQYAADPGWCYLRRRMGSFAKVFEVDGVIENAQVEAVGGKWFRGGPGCRWLRGSENLNPSGRRALSRPPVNPSPSVSHR